MEDFYIGLDREIKRVTDELDIKNLFSIQDYYNENDYWSRLANFNFFIKLFDTHHYHFLYEIQGLSSQIHFGLANCFLLRDKISQIRGKPNIFNHRYTFMIESTIHCIYAYWNRVGLVLNTYLKKPKDIKRTYFSIVVQQLMVDYPELFESKYFNWVINVMKELNQLDRNEFAHNNSLIMQDFLPQNSKENQIDLKEYPELLLNHNKYIVDDIDNLVNLITEIEEIINFIPN